MHIARGANVVFFVTLRSFASQTVTRSWSLHFGHVWSVPAVTRSPTIREQRTANSALRRCGRDMREQIGTNRESTTTPTVNFSACLIVRGSLFETTPILRRTCNVFRGHAGSGTHAPAAPFPSVAALPGP